MIRLELLAPETVHALRRVACRALRDARHAAWALENFDADEELAAAALMNEEAVSWAEQSLAYVKRWPSSAQYVPHWETELADRRQLLARKPVAPQLPSNSNLDAWMHERLGLVADESEQAVLARKLGTEAWAAFIIGEAGHDRIALANRLALLVGAFPIASWVEIDRATAEPDLAYVIGHDLAYGEPRCSPESAAAQARRFLDAAGPDALYFINGTAMSSKGEPARARTSSPVTTATFDYALVALGVERSGIAVFTGED